MPRLILFANLRNEAHNLGWFVPHYLALGVDSFHIVDNGSTDGTADLLSAWPEVTVHVRHDSFRASRSGTAWLNELRARHGVGHWCLFVDADEMLVYPGWPEVLLPDLAARMQRRGQRCMIAPMIDMFNAEDPFFRSIGPAERPLDAFPDFLPGLMRIHPTEQFPFVGFHGGAREYFFGTALRELTGSPSPNLRKIPLVHVHGDGHDYVTPHSTRILPPSDLTGALLHFKINGRILQSAITEGDRAEHAEAAVEYRAYQLSFERELCPPVPSKGVASWRGVSDLVERGLVHCPQHWAAFLARKGVTISQKIPADQSLALWPGLAEAVKLATSL